MIFGSFAEAECFSGVDGFENPQEEEEEEEEEEEQEEEEEEKGGGYVFLR